MLLDLLQLLPQDPGDGMMIIAMIGCALGAGLWVAGIKVSRPLVTLVTVLVGAGIGLQLPRWFGWSVSGAGPAVGGAVVLGVSGFVLHRMWIGLSLGVVLAIWAALAIWLTMHGKSTWTWPAFDESNTVWSYSKSVWENLPADVTRLVPWACGVAIVSSLAAAILWPRLTTVTHWSALGLSLMIGLGLATIALGKRMTWLEKAPQKTWAQLVALFGMLLLGIVIQWKLSPAKAGAKSEPKPKADDPQ